MKKHPKIKRILAILGVITVVMSSLMLPIGAEATKTPSYISHIDWTDYPGSNLIKQPYNDKESKTENGVTFNVDKNGAIKATGEATSTSIYKIGTIAVKAGVTYTISSGTTDSAYNTHQMWARNISAGIKDVYNIQEGKTFTPTTNGLIEISIFVYKDYTIDQIYYPMLNKGETAYPYMPYLPYYFEQAFNNGYSEGNNSGYQEGYEKGFDDGHDNGENVGYEIGYNDGHNIGTLEGKKEGYDQAVQELEKQAENILDKATFQWAADVDDQPYQKYIFTPNKINGSVNFKNIVEEFSIFIDQNNFDPHLNKCDIILTWNDNDTFDYNTFPLFITGSSLVSSGSLITTNGEAYTLITANEGEKRQLIAQEAKGKILTVKSITIYVGRPQDLLNEFTLFTENENYVNGYNNGYKAGYKENVEYNNFLKEKESYDNGYKKGRTEGIEYGLSLNKDGNWKSMLSAVVEVTSTVFQNLFNFSIFDLDMRVAFGTLMTLCLIAIILKYTLFR